jgi:hypothetical protein
MDIPEEDEFQHTALVRFMPEREFCGGNPVSVALQSLARSRRKI